MPSISYAIIFAALLQTYRHSLFQSFQHPILRLIASPRNKALCCYRSITVFDIKTGEGKKEISYHNLLVGILTGNADWLVKSNVEAGEGFADIIVETEDPNAGIVVELKYTKNYDEMEQACRAALDQINDWCYQEYLLNDGRKDITLYGIAFCKKRCKAMASGNL